MLRDVWRRAGAERAGSAAGYQGKPFAAPGTLSAADAAAWRNAYRQAWAQQVADGQFPRCPLGDYE